MSESRGFLGQVLGLLVEVRARSREDGSRNITCLFSGAFSKVSRIGASIRVGASSFFFVLCFDFLQRLLRPCSRPLPRYVSSFLGSLTSKSNMALFSTVPLCLKSVVSGGRFTRTP